MNKNVFKTGEGVKIAFSGAVEKQKIVKMVENCATGQCECMSDETKQKIGEANSKIQSGTGNSQYGTCWIHSIEEQTSKKINKDDLDECF